MSYVHEIFLIMKKEFQVISRDRRSFALYLLGPLLIITMFGIGTGTPPTNPMGINLHVALVNEDNSELADDLATRFRESSYIVMEYETDRRTAMRLLNEMKIDTVIIIPQDFGRKVQMGTGVDLELHVDNTLLAIDVAAEGASAEVLRDFYTIDLPKRNPIFAILSQLEGPEIDVQRRYRLTETGIEPLFVKLYPVITPFIIMSFAMMMSGLSIVGERMAGTLPRLLKTPTSKSRIVVGKLSFYFMISIWQCLIVLIVPFFLFGLPINGNPLLAYLGLVLTAFVALNWGMLYSLVAKTDRQVTEMNTNTIIVLMLIGGILLPVKDMPPVAQIVAKSLPIYYSVEIVRTIVLRGLEFASIQYNFLILLVYGIVLLGICIGIFNVLKE